MSDGTRLGVKRALARVGRLVPVTCPRRVILAYHAVGSSPWAVPVQRFQEQVDWLVANTCLRSVPEMLVGPGTSDNLQVALTFDDGYQNVLTHAAPLLEAVGGRPAVFINTSRIGDEMRLASNPADGYYPGEHFLVWDEVRQLRANGWDIGSHGVDHPDLTREPMVVVRDQMMISKAILEDRLAEPCQVFAYPFGRNNAGVRAAAARAGYRFALGAIHGVVHSRMNLFAVPRIDIRRHYELRDFVDLVRGRWDYLHLLQTARHSLRFFS